MKILRVAGDIYPEVVGGVGLHVHEMSKMQSEMGHDVTVLSKKTGEKPNREFRDGYELYRYDPDIELFGNPISLNVFNRLRSCVGDFDVVHAHSHLFFTTNLTAFLSKFRETPLVITNHGLESQTAPLWFSNLYNKTLGRWTFRQADAIITYSKEEKQKIRELGIKNKIETIHNGINTDTFKPLNQVEEKNQILWVGRFQPGKGVKHLIKAFKQLKNKGYKNLKLKMVGEGPLKKEIIKKTKKHGLDQSIIFKDFTPNKEMPQLYNESKAFILPSLTEGVPRTVLESLSCGTPVITTNLPQLKQIVNGCGYMVHKKNPHQLAEKTSKLLNNETKRNKFKENGRKKIKKHYSWSDTVRKTNLVYKNLINSNQ
ncbi:glycosyltransferase family 4 protein [Methanonatronarchaeum sp. AMET-Sl]|uniref:glycosyltransferase family 4 protein n=1 Tax=Methanonatronarchaeum sp. AMET-Sl TaxID=3037654 RepID=UPI00244E1563|nr:glycosyltransferase family 4 protein [Methanonatronarchaeum sp. AMET-Sl]WGI17648.1 glycosyltransferase family 4 protein [Methanonatronarchaeum sp. AMET-Sl]